MRRTLPTRGHPGRRTRHLWIALTGALVLLLGLTPATAAGNDARPAGGGEETETAQAQELTWTADDRVDVYASAPQTAVAGPATIVFDNSEAAGNTTAMPHTLTFDTSNSDYNNDVQLNILANPTDSNGGVHTAEVTLTPGVYRYYCAIPGHGQMQGTLVVTEDDGEDTTPPEVTASVDGVQNDDGDYFGSATVTLDATDSGSGVESVEFAEGADGEWQPYTDPVVVDRLGDHLLRYRATDAAGNVSEEGTVEFTVVAPPTDDEEPPETSATVSGETDEDGNYLGMATVTVTASDAGAGVDSIEYALGADGEWQSYDAPVMIHETGTHLLRYRATDRAGNVSEEQSVEFTVVEVVEEDTTPPEVSATVSGNRDAGGAYVGHARVTVEATDEESGVERVEYSLDAGPYLEYGDPVIVDRVGRHTVSYRATDAAGNTSEASQVAFTVARGGGVPAPNCAEFDERRTVIVGDVDTGVPNRITDNRCRINERIEDERDWSSHALFLRHVNTVLGQLLDEGVIDERERGLIERAARDSGIGTPGQTDGYRKIFDGTEETFESWQQVGGGSFELTEDGAMTSGTDTPGMGMLWFPERQYENFSLKLQWRDDAADGMFTNGGVFVRFPDVHDHPEENRPEWVAINYGHEVQINDRPDGDMYKTGSIYGFDRVGLGGAGVTPKGTWNDYEIRVIGQSYEIYRNGVLINEFENFRGQKFEPPRAGDPGTSGRRYASGYLGLQVHSVSEVVSYRDIRVKEL
ncbi:OmpL47-type beta-barrel domain-containing protein [Streptomyces otsuchiensis]|uniref:OmpL47-type beta-barrel domain-containing protein n=1 Tax=Streptomyces otsuchiensis TaxID=2681388 RepID=UPI001030A639|nr:family 16 glycoside hydrolase [Streptomyces otsuchiensis]